MIPRPPLDAIPDCPTEADMEALLGELKICRKAVRMRAYRNFRFTGHIIPLGDEWVCNFDNCLLKCSTCVLWEYNEP